MAEDFVRRFEYKAMSLDSRLPTLDLPLNPIDDPDPGGATTSSTSCMRSAHGPLSVAGVVARASGGGRLPGRSTGQCAPAASRVEGELPQSVFPGDDDSVRDFAGGMRKGSSAGRQLEDLQRAGPSGRRTFPGKRLERAAG